jgi:hypothetical protein
MRARSLWWTLRSKNKAKHMGVAAGQPGLTSRFLLKFVQQYLWRPNQEICSNYTISGWSFLILTLCYWTQNSKPSTDTLDLNLKKKKWQERNVPIITIRKIHSNGSFLFVCLLVDYCWLEKQSEKKNCTKNQLYRKIIVGLDNVDNSLFQWRLFGFLKQFSHVCHVHFWKHWLDDLIIVYIFLLYKY